jgi:hypothetical protein
LSGLTTGFSGVSSAGARILRKRGWLLGVWSITLAIWVLVPFVKFGGSWPVRGTGLVLAVAFGAGFAGVVRASFRRAAARPPVYPGSDRWLAQVPFWVSAPVIICVYMAVPVVIIVGTALLFHRMPFMNVWGLCLCLIVACGAGAFWPLAWRARSRTRA